jgi:hypothetical protein
MKDMEQRDLKSVELGGVSTVVACAALLVIAAVIPAFASTQQSAATSPAPARKTAAVRSDQQTFRTPGEACDALIAALKANDSDALLKILGAGAKDIITSGDPTEDKNNRAQFIERYQQMHRLVTEPDGTTTLYIGSDNWPTPIPLIHRAGGWYFDTAAGRQEILYRRVGENELAVIQTCHELVDAEKEYYGVAHDGNPAGQYAQKFFSDPGKQNGLYWDSANGQPQSPIGPLVANAAAQGYTRSEGHTPQPYQGYYFRVLTGRGAAGSASSVSYVQDGKMTRGFAFIAYPAEYRSSGVMTFIVDQDGIVYEKDLGPRTAEIAKAMARYERDASWRKSD